MSDRLRILIIEDIPTDAELMESELQDAGITFSAKRVETREAYIEALSTFLPDVILSDYSLPAFDGIAVLQVAQKRAPDTPFIFVTGALGEELAIDLLKQGATDYVLKSRLSRLPVAVNRALREVEERKERERAYRDLRESEERHRVTLQTAMDGFLRTDMQGRILEVNEMYCRMSGYSEQELVTMNVADLEAVHTTEMIAATLRIFAEKGPRRFESLHRRKDGSLFNVEISGQYQPFAGGQIVVFVRDITERKRTEDALRQSEAYIAEAERLAHTGSWAFDLAGNEYIYSSKEWLRIFELDEQEVPSRELISRLIHPEDWGGVNADFEKLLREKVDTSSEFRIVLPSGTFKHIQAIRHPVLNSSGDIVRIVGTVMDITDRKRAEEALRRSENYLAEAQRLSHTGSWALDVSTKEYIYGSEEDFRLWGFDPQQPIPTREAVFQRIHPDDRDSVEKSRDRLIREKTDTSIEFRIVMPNGTVKHIHTIQHPIVNGAGDVVQMMGTSMDITERKRAEEALRQSEAYLAEAQRLSHTGSWAFDVAGDKYIYFSEECSRIFELNAQEGLPNREEISRLIDPEDWDEVNRDLEKLLREKVDTSSEFRVTLPSGTVKHVLVIRHPVLNDAGDVVQVVGTAIDITERKRAEAEISRLENYLSNIIDSMPAILVGMDNARTVTQWNRQAEAFTGIPAGDVIGKPVKDLLPKFAPWIMKMAANMDEHRPSSMEKVLVEKDGQRRFYDVILYPLLDRAEGAVLRIEDVTERARIQELMIQTEKMMSIGGLAAGMAHEINNPLGIIVQAARNIERRISLELPANRKVSEELGLNLEGMRAYFDKRQISDAIASIRTASSRAARIVANMLQFSRRADTTIEFASLAKIVDQALELAASDYDLKKKYDFRSINIIKDYQDMPELPIVSVEIEQVILNLLKNAAQAMTANPPDRRPSITFRLRCEDGYAVLEVEDNGPGMTEDIRPRVFEPFFTTKEPGVGTGLGLSVSYMIVTQNHKGLMEVESTPGRGTVFKVRLPMGGSKT